MQYRCVVSAIPKYCHFSKPLNVYAVKSVIAGIVTKRT
jgi:hypothetical protein